ncbi:3-keto-5-aminohexanoate cleavage protein [uncultured Jannaschia sp.]|uniref:3-keto-5-aminohexanoate cleavage protein n=1 Tax=uncultured Jannaschia sp. TaxID=293347 RepID=UPI00260D67D9|nr:3-keto-5-aminohexanoate cleavage protein [uncultured Jannaschia sp.]
MARPLVMVAPTGARLTRSDHPALPVSVPEIVETTRRCTTVGADALHLHVRDADGAHSLDPGLYREALAELARALPALPVQVTTEAAGRYDVTDQLACLAELHPAWASVAIREMVRDPDVAARFYATAEATGTRLQHILYDAADAVRLAKWQADGRVRPDQTEAILVLGRYGDGTPSDPTAIAAFVAALPGGTPWMLCAFGPSEHACLREAARLGGDVRVGFENSRTAPDGTAWTDNAASVAALCSSLAETVA